jgi:hypothetical protein
MKRVIKMRSNYNFRSKDTDYPKVLKVVFLLIENNYKLLISKEIKPRLFAVSYQVTKELTTDCKNDSSVGAIGNVLARVGSANDEEIFAFLRPTTHFDRDADQTNPSDVTNQFGGFQVDSKIEDEFIASVTEDFLGNSRVTPPAGRPAYQLTTYENFLWVSEYPSDWVGLQSEICMVTEGWSPYSLSNLYSNRLGSKTALLGETEGANSGDNLGSTSASSNVSNVLRDFDREGPIQPVTSAITPELYAVENSSNVGNTEGLVRIGLLTGVGTVVSLSEACISNPAVSISVGLGGRSIITRSFTDDLCCPSSAYHPIFNTNSGDCTTTVIDSVQIINYLFFHFS